MSQKRTKPNRLFLSLTFISVGMIIFIYGSRYHSIAVYEGPATDTPPVLPETKDKPVDTLALSEFDLITDITVGGVIRWDSGPLQKTYSRILDETGKQVKPPSLCPT